MRRTLTRWPTDDGDGDGGEGWKMRENRVDRPASIGTCQDVKQRWEWPGAVVDGHGRRRGRDSGAAWIVNVADRERMMAVLWTLELRRKM